MTAQADVMPGNHARPKRPQGIVGRLKMLLFQPKAFFQTLPHNSQWLAVGLFIMVVAGYASVNQLQPSSRSAAATGAAQSQNIAVSYVLPAATAEAGNTVTQSGSPSVQTGGTTSAAASSTINTASTLTTALLAACGLLATWVGEATLLSLVTMLRGNRPRIRRSLQVAIWASVPLALMLILRQTYFAAGGSGGNTGLSLLLTQWSGYAQLPSAAQRILAVFMSNLSLFWLWGLLLLYLGARDALHGQQWSAVLVLLMWVSLSTVVPALVSQPSLTVAPIAAVVTATPRATTQTATGQSTTTTGSASQAQGAFSGGDLGGFSGAPPDGGPPS